MILHELSSATGDKGSNKALAKRCLEMPALMHSVAEGMRTGTPEARKDCAEILIDVAKRRIDLLSGFVTEFLELSKYPQKRIARLGFKGLALLLHADPSRVYGERQFLIDTANKGGTIGLAAAQVLGELAGSNPNYRGKLIAPIIRLLRDVPTGDLLKWVKAIGPAARGSTDAIDRLRRELEPRQCDLDDFDKEQLEKLLARLSRRPKSSRASR